MDGLFYRFEPFFDLSRSCQLTQRQKLETAAGSAIRYFKIAHGINVPRTRFLPVKNCSDLLLVKSDLFMLVNGRLVMNEDRMFGTLPVVKLGGHFKKVTIFYN